MSTRFPTKNFWTADRSSNPEVAIARPNITRSIQNLLQRNSLMRPEIAPGPPSRVQSIHVRTIRILDWLNVTCVSFSLVLTAYLDSYSTFTLALSRGKGSRTNGSSKKSSSHGTKTSGTSQKSSGSHKKASHGSQTSPESPKPAHEPGSFVFPQEPFSSSPPAEPSAAGNN